MLSDDQVLQLSFDDWPVANEYLVELGRITCAWGSLEHSLNTNIGKLAGFDEANDPIPFIFIIHSSFPQRLDMFGSLCAIIPAREWL